MGASKGAPKPGWYRDPTGRHDVRRWDGDGWSEWVMDGPRRHFDDIDGCGGPPVDELVPVDDGKLGTRAHGAGGGLARILPMRKRRGGKSRAGEGERLSPTAVAGADAARRLPVALATALAAAVVAYGVSTFVDGDVAGSLVPSLVRRLAVPFVLAAIAFEAIAAGGLVSVRGHGGSPSPLRPPNRFTGEELLRGGIAFLLALFASSFVTSTVGVRAFGWDVLPASFDPLLAVEVVVTVLVAPVVEERLFRGLLLVALRDRFGPVVAVFGQAAVAGAASGWVAAPGARGVAIVAATAAAAVFGWFAHTTDDLKPGMLGHAFLAAWLLAGRIRF